MNASLNLNLFDDAECYGAEREELSAGAVILRRFAITDQAALLAALNDIAAQAPFRHMVTPGGLKMSVPMTNCGELGWVSDRRGYRYDEYDPDSAKRWPPMPDAFLTLAKNAATAAGFENFQPDACLINRYSAGTRLSLHQDKNESDFTAPIVSVSLGIPAIFLFGGMQRTDKPTRILLTHGDVAVWGGPARLHYHGVLPIQAAHHPATGECRINLTFRKAGSVAATMLGRPHQIDE